MKKDMNPIQTGPKIKAEKIHWKMHLLILLGIIVLLLIGAYVFLHLFTRHNKELAVPDFTSMSIQKAQTLASAMELRLEVTDSVYNKRLPRGIITRQNPVEGSKVKKNRRILLTINSMQPKQTTMPALVGFSLRQAKTEINAQGLSVGRLIYVEDLATNNVLAQIHDGEDIAPKTVLETESTIDLVLGLNSRVNAHTYIPNVRSYKLNTAKDMLTDNSLNIQKVIYDETVRNYRDTVEAIVYNQSPIPSDIISYPLGHPVTLYMSKDASKIVIDPIITDTLQTLQDSLSILIDSTRITTDTILISSDTLNVLAQ